MIRGRSRPSWNAEPRPASRHPWSWRSRLQHPAGCGRPRLQALLVRRGRPVRRLLVAAGRQAVGHEALDDAAWRQLAEKTALRASYLEQLYTFELCDASRQMSRGRRLLRAGPHRRHRDRPRPQHDGGGVVPRRRAAHGAGLRQRRDPALRAPAPAQQGGVRARRVPVPAAGVHDGAAPRRLRGDPGAPIDPTNFRRRVEATGTIVPTGHVVSGGRHRPPALYRCADDPASLVKTMRPRRPLRSLPEPTPSTPVRPNA